MERLEKELHYILSHLRETYKAMNQFMADSEDFSAVEIMRAEFRDLRDSIREWAQLQYGLSLRKKGESKD